MTTKARDVLELIKAHEIALIDLKCVDVSGAWQHYAVPAEALDEAALIEGVCFDGSTVLRPDLTTANVDNLSEGRALSLIAERFDPVERAFSDRDPRAIAKRAESHLQTTGVADAARFGVNIEAHIFESAEYENDTHAAGYAIDSIDSHTSAAICAETVVELRNWSIDAAVYGAGSAGQIAISLPPSSLLQAADNAMVSKHVLKRVVARHGKAATFMPLPLSGHHASGMHLQQSLWKAGKPLFFDAKGFAECSQTMLYHIGGLLTHIDSLTSLCAPTTNSYKRLASHRGAPVHVAFSARDQTSAVGIVSPFPGNANAKSLEFRPSDPSANPYLAFAALTCAGIDGIRRKIDPVKAGFGPIDQAIEDLDATEAARLRTIPASLRAAVAALESDSAYLTEGGVFSPSFIAGWIRHKRKHDLDQIESRPHPYEFHLYYDC